MEELAPAMEGEVPVSATLPSPPCTSLVETLSLPLVETPSPSLAKNAATSPVFIRGLNFAPDSEDEAEKDEAEKDVVAGDEKEVTAAESNHVTIDREEWRCRRGIGVPCSRCGLIHEEYRLTSWIYGFKEFDCKVIFPNIDDLKMDGTTILLPAHIWMTESDADIPDSV